jgi:hypothetical protein
MDHWLFFLQLGVIVAVVVLVAGGAAAYALRSARAGAALAITASFQELQKGWYQLHIAIANRAPYGVVVDELRRIHPRSARLMAPIKQVSTREGAFQVWTHPSTDKTAISIPLDLRLGPREAPNGTVSRASEAHVTAWLFLSGSAEAPEVVLELATLDRAGHLRRHRFGARRRAKR